MKREIYELIVGSLPHGRTLFRYAPGHHAAHWLLWMLDRGWTLEEIRHSEWAHLLHAKSVAAITKQVGNDEALFVYRLSKLVSEGIVYRLTLGRWGDESRYWQDYQLSRAGHNLVLQLNFGHQHNAELNRAGSSIDPDLFTIWSHPVSERECTLAWARIDVDFERGEALIEEIQSDWVRLAKRYARDQRLAEEDMAYLARGRAGMSSDSKKRAEALERYISFVLPRHAARWQETMLAASLCFIGQELGLHRVFMHQFESGNRLKNIPVSYGAPPRSIYQKWPRKLGFQPTRRGPGFLADRVANLVAQKKSRFEPAFWCLDLPRGTSDQATH